MGEIVKVKHLLYTIGGMVIFAFGLGANVNAKLRQVDDNTLDIVEIKKERSVDRALTIRNHNEVMSGFTRLELELKLKLKDKQNRKD